ncbi:putative pyruvate kinase [Helianthus annuus]|nr:putative pyruvate kinase [Helianthus annuus]
MSLLSMATFEVIERIGNELRCKCTDPGLLLPRAKFSLVSGGTGNLSKNIMSSQHSLKSLISSLEGVAFIALSFVKDAAVVVKHLKDQK